MKRILLIDHPQFTSATYFLWQGLKELEALYPEALSVSCYPYIPTNYDDDQYDLNTLDWFKSLNLQVEESKKGSPLPYGIPAFQPTETLTSRDETLMRRGCPWRRFPKATLLTSEDQAVLELEAGKFDLVILGNSHRVPTILLGRLRERVHRKLPPLVYFDAGERDELNEHWIHVFRPDLTFKQILTPEVKAKGLSVKIPGYTFKMYPLPLSSPIVDCQDASLQGLPVQWLRHNSKISTKMLPVFYALGETWPDRDLVRNAMDLLVLRRDLPRIKNCSYTNYNIIMAQSSMAVTMRGSGRDTNHYWEIPLYKTAMVSDGTMGCIHPYPFEDKKTAFFYRSISELVEVVEAHIGVDGPGVAEREKVALAGQEHLERYHSTAARAVFFLDVLGHELSFFDPLLKNAIDLWKADRRWDGRPWEGPVV